MKDFSYYFVVLIQLHGNVSYVSIEFLHRFRYKPGTESGVIGYSFFWASFGEDMDGALHFKSYVN